MTDLSWLDGQEFYELMQVYRHVNQREYLGEEQTVAAFEAVKDYIRAEIEAAARAKA